MTQTILLMLAKIGKSLLTEYVFKQLFLAAGNALVASTKNELDDNLWAPVRDTLDGKVNNR